jgi:CRP/FNR family cyclic AMP-dependent transcriptional regulator
MARREPTDPHKPRKPRASTPAHLAVALHTVLDAVDGARTNLKVSEGKTVFEQGEAADAVFYIKSGRIQLNVVSDQGKEGVIALLGPGEYFGEGCLGHQPVRLASAVATAASALVKIDRVTMAHLLREKADFSKQFTAFLVSRTIQVEADLVDQLFNSSEKRLARLLLLLANYNNDGVLHPIVPRISQDVLAARVGTTRARINFFMNKFRKLGLIEYNGDIKVHTSLLNVIVHD